MDTFKEILSYLPSSPIAIFSTGVTLFCLVNIKSLPFIWHIRVLSAFLQHRNSKPHNPKDILNPYLAHLKGRQTSTPRLFQPLVTSTRCSILEIDYALHKSNSTYFSDLDISRAHLLLELFKDGIATLEEQLRRDGDKKGGRARVLPVLGAASTMFKRAIPPLAKYEVVTRVLCWDDKWIYLVSWFVVPGSTHAAIHNGSNGNIQREEEVDNNSKDRTSRSQKQQRPRQIIYATSLAKYVVKSGRLTIPPARLLESSNLLPIGDSKEDKQVQDIIERYRQKGEKFGKAFGELDTLSDEFENGQETLGEFRDLF